MTSYILKLILITVSFLLILGTLAMVVRGQLGTAAILGVLTTYAVNETRTIFGSNF